jgi:hypothetical protein
MPPSSFDAEIFVTPATIERLSSDVRARVRAGATRIALAVAPDDAWDDEGLASFSRESQRLSTWLVGLLGAGKAAPRIAVDLPESSRLAACYAAAMRPYAVLVRRQRGVRVTTALVAATVAGVAVTACGGTTQASGATDGGSVSDAASGQGGYGGGVCAVATGGYGGGVCAVAVDSGVVGAGGYGAGVCNVGTGGDGTGGYGLGTGGYIGGVCAYYPDTGIGGGVCPVMIDLDAGPDASAYAGGGVCK